MRLFLLLILVLSVTPCFAAPKVVVSIAPLHSLTSALMTGVGEPQLLLRRSDSPHSASLRPSQATALTDADLMIWVGPELESFLTQPVMRLLKPRVELQLLREETLLRLPQREGGLWEEDLHEGEDEHQHAEYNPHIWLSPENANEIARLITQRLILIDPANREAYQKNLNQLNLRIAQTRQQLSQRLLPFAGKPYLVFHDAYPYFEKAFNLNAIGSVRISAEQAPGARRVQQIREKVSRSQAVCLFSEPQFSPALAQTLATGTTLRLGVLDPLGRLTGNAEDRWFQLMEDLGEGLTRCLGGSQP